MRRFVGLWVILCFLTGCGAAGSDAPLPTAMQLPTAQAVSSPTPASLAELPTEPLPYNSAITAQLDERTAALWRFEAQRGDTVRIRTQATNGRLKLNLLTEDGMLLAEDETALEALITADGVYLVRVEALSATTDYQIGLTSNFFPPPPPATLTPIPVMVGVPTPTPALVTHGLFMAQLTSKETSSGEFKVADAPHLYTFDANAGQVARLHVTPVNGIAQPLMTLLSPTGALIASDMFSDNGSGPLLQNIPLVAGGTYTVQLDAAGNPGLYTIRLDLTDSPVPVTPTVVITPTDIPPTPVLTPDYPQAERGVRLSDNAPVRDQIRQPTDLNTHSFYAYQGDSLTVGVAPISDSALIPRIELIDPDGNLVGTASGGSTPIDRDAVISGHVAPIEGPYTVYVTGEGGTVGGYFISYGYESARFNIMRGELAPDVPVVAAFERRATADIWHIYLNAGDVVSATVLPLDTNIAPILEFVHENGTLLGVDRESGGERTPQINGVRALESGFHYLRVRPITPAQIGAYQITWRYLDYAPTPTPPAGSLPILAVNGEVEPGGYVFYPFYAEAGQTIKIYANAVIGSPLDPVAALIAPDGRTVGGSDDAPESLNAFFEVTLTETGTYQIRVNGYLSGGAFVLYVERIFK